MKDLLGKHFNCLTVTKFAHIDGRGHAQWVCECDCGKRTMASTGSLISGTKKSCGHLRQKALKEYRNKFFKHDSAQEMRVFAGTTIDDALDELEAFT